LFSPLLSLFLFLSPPLICFFTNFLCKINRYTYIFIFSEKRGKCTRCRVREIGATESFAGGGGGDADAGGEDADGGGEDTDDGGGEDADDGGGDDADDGGGDDADDDGGDDADDGGDDDADGNGDDATAIAIGDG